MFKRFIYRLFGVYHFIHIMDTKHNIIKRDVKVNHLPRTGDLLYFDDNDVYHIVINLIFKISDRSGVWVVTKKFTGDIKKND